MDFKKATDDLFMAIGHEDLAEAVGVSIASVRQARLDGDAKAHRSPPPGWERAALKLADGQAKHFQRLVERLRHASAGDPPRGTSFQRRVGFPAAR